MKFRTPLVFGVLLAAAPAGLHAGCCASHDAAEAYQQAVAIGEYRILSTETLSLESGSIVTRIRASLTKSLKGDAPAELTLDSPGGRLRNIVEVSSQSLDLKEGEDCIFHLRQEEDGSWKPIPFHTLRHSGSAAERKALREFVRHGARGRHRSPREANVTISEHSGIPGSNVTATGYLQDASGHPSRFTAGDGGLEIPYLVDVDVTKLPPGMDQAGALAAVEEALGVWEAASSLRFRFAGIQDFGAAAGSITAVDRHLRIQLHDSHDAITPPAAGVAGVQMTVPPNGTTLFCGGMIGSQGFQEILRSFVVIEHDDPLMDDVPTFKQVLTHEIGHAIGLAHSSINASEPDPILKNATMYYKASDDGRGAALTAYDEDRAAFGYPVTGTPPYAPDRLIRAVCRTGTSSTLPAVPGVNRITLRAIDRDGEAPVPSVAYSFSAGKFSLDGDQLVYSASDWLTKSRLTDDQILTGNHAYHYAYVQFGDGTNLSRAAKCTVIETAGDSTPADGLPNTWMTTHFGSTAVAAAGAISHPDSDPDGDGLTNREEFFLSTDPKSAASGTIRPVYDHAARNLTFSPMAFAAYAVESATSLSGPWTLRQVGTDSAGNGGPVTTDLSGGTTPEREFFRVVTGP